MAKSIFRSTVIGIPGLFATLWVFTEAHAGPSSNDFPTIVRIEYVNECIALNGGAHARMYQCACVIDRIAAQLSYEEFLEASTFARYANLPGDGGAVFRDSEEGRKLAKRYRALEGDAYRACGLPPQE